jgi:hypothetical protein
LAEILVFRRLSVWGCHRRMDGIGMPQKIIRGKGDDDQKITQKKYLWFITPYKTPSKYSYKMLFAYHNTNLL